MKTFLQFNPSNGKEKLFHAETIRGAIVDHYFTRVIEGRLSPIEAVEFTEIEMDHPFFRWAEVPPDTRPW